MKQLFWVVMIVTAGLAGGCTDGGSAPAVDTEVPPRPPNVIVILADDLGYGDLSCYGSTQAVTPHLDRMAAGGVRFTDFYAFPSCSPSRAALLTGCYPPRVGIPDVIGPAGPAWTAERQYGLAPAEHTVAELLAAAGYATGMVGKWHLGHFPQTMPGRHGFGEFFGLPYSNDMLPEAGYPDLILLDGTDTLEANPDQRYLTRRYTDRAIDFVRRHQDTSFFLYLAHSMPHVPLFATPEFAGRSGRGLYADVVAEIDAGVGRLLATLDELAIDERTLVIFTSDNGPWLTYGNHAGSAGPLREGKGTTFEGGMRVPFIARWPGQIPDGSISQQTGSLADVLPTLVGLTPAQAPPTKIDGKVLALQSPLTPAPASAPPEEVMCYYRSGVVEAVRRGRWKLHLPHDYRYVEQIGNDGARGNYGYRKTGRELYDLHGDPGERYDRAAEYPAVVRELEEIARAHQQEMDENRREPFRPSSGAD